MNDIERRCVRAILLDIRQQFAPLVRCDRSTLFEWTYSIPARRAAQRRLMRPPASYPNWNSRRLNGCRTKGDFLYIVLVTLITKGLTCPQACQYLQSLVKPTSANLGIGCLLEEAKVPLNRI